MYVYALKTRALNSFVPDIQCIKNIMTDTGAGRSNDGRSIQDIKIPPT